MASGEASAVTSRRAYRSSSGTSGAGTAGRRPRSGRRGGATGQELLHLGEGPDRPLAAGAVRDLDAAGRERPRADGEDPRHPEQLRVGELDAGRLLAVVVEDLEVRSGRRGEVVEPLRRLGDERVLVGADGDEVRPVRGHLGRPGDALLVVMGLHDAGDVAPEPDAVRAHDDRVPLAVLAQVLGTQRRRVLGPELEDVADLDPVAQDDGLAALRAGVALAHAGEVRDDVRGEVPGHVHVAQVVAGPVGARDQVRALRRERIHDDDRIRGADRRPVPGLHASGLDLLDLGRAQPARGLDRVDQLGLVDVVVAAHDGHDEAAVAGDEEGRLRRPARGNAQERGEAVDGGGVRGRDLLDRQELLGDRVRRRWSGRPGGWPRSRTPRTGPGRPRRPG